MNNNLMAKEHWEDTALLHNERLPICVSPSIDEHYIFQQYLSGSGGKSILEIGCAPGGWLAYFATNYGLQANGIEYVREGAELTRRNLQLQGIKPNIVQQDFFGTNLPISEFDVIFSRGFVEHFNSTADVIGRLVSFAKPGGVVITTVPNFLGFNGYTRKHFARESYDSHVKINLGRLAREHEAAGVRTAFCGYTGYPRLIMPWDAGFRGGASKFCELFLDIWKRGMNRALREIFLSLDWVPKTQVLSPTLLYLGRRAR
jgi:2-polyprenyl-3-methyl-5-hydroxy-6-metoxy-1,4-benzoquinol methylase